MKTAMQEAIEKFEHALSYNVEGGICELYRSGVKIKEEQVIHGSTDI